MSAPLTDPSPVMSPGMPAYFTLIVVPAPSTVPSFGSPDDDSPFSPLLPQPTHGAGGRPSAARLASAFARAASAISFVTQM